MFKHHPLDIHQDAPLAHAASLAAGAQGKFWEFHDRLFANPGKLNREDLLRYARELGLDAARFERDLLDARLKQVIDADRAEAVSLGATGTPAFFVNGRYLSGAKPFEEFAKLINAELGRLRLPVPPEATQR